MVISAGVEGILDEAVVKHLINRAGAELGRTYGRSGKAKLKSGIRGFNSAAIWSPWLVLVDLDKEAECAAELRREWLPEPSRFMCFRVAVREVESWLLADRENIGRHLSVSRDLVPSEPELLVDPKGEMVNLAGRSRRRAIREDMVPRQGSGRQTGPAYDAQLIEFVRNLWDLDAALGHSDSLSRAYDSLARLVAEDAHASGV